MNCEKLHQDIEKLKEQYNSFSSKLDFSTKEAKGKIALSEQLRNTLALQDQILESYLPDFFEKNPELLQLNLGDRIDDRMECKDAYGNPANIRSITQLSDKSIMIGGWNGALYHATIDENGNVNLSNRIECKDADSKPAYIISITQLSDKSIMLGGHDGTFYHATVDENGNVNLSDRIECKDAYDNPAIINSITQLSDKSIMLGGDDGTLYHATVDENGNVNLSDRIECKDAYGNPADIRSITQLSDTPTKASCSAGGMAPSTTSP